MARPLRIDYPGAFYHVTCRGNQRKNIFADDHDRGTLLTGLESWGAKRRIYLCLGTDNESRPYTIGEWAAGIGRRDWQNSCGVF
jgi:hypothetical protein